MPAASAPGNSAAPAPAPPSPATPAGPGAVREVFAAFSKLGCTAFGGPVAHLGYFHTEFVERRRWLGEAEFADLVALCQFLPGPASSQVAFALGLRRAGWRGALTASACFTLPSAVLMIAFGYGVLSLGPLANPGWLQGLKAAAVAVVAQAVLTMARKLCPDLPRAALAVAAAALALWLGSAWSQIAALALGTLAGWVFLREETTPPATPSSSIPSTPVAPATPSPLPFNASAPAPTPAPLAPAPPAVPLVPRTPATPLTRQTSVATGALLLALWVALLALLPLGARAWPDSPFAIFGRVYRAGSLVFGGGHVVLPLLRAEVVPPGWTDDDTFLAGYGAAQAMPGPLFTFAAYLGVVLRAGWGGWVGGLWALLAIFLPAWLLIGGALPFWETLRTQPALRAALRGTNAAVVGVLLAALWQPVGREGIHTWGHFALALAVFIILIQRRWPVPAWAAVLAAAGAGWLCF